MKTLKPSVAIAALLAFGSAFLTGCGEDLPTLNEVTGTVSYNDAVLTTGVVTFEIVDGNSSIPFTAEISEDGQYQISTDLTGRAIITVQTETSQGRPGYVQIPAEFGDPRSSGLEFVVQEGEHVHNIVLD